MSHIRQTAAMADGGDIGEAAKIASAMLEGRLRPLQAALRIVRYVDPARSVWEDTKGAHGPLTAIYMACDEADRMGFIGENLDMWHPEVRDRKQSELAEVEARLDEPIRIACQAILTYAATRSFGTDHQPSV
jgi:hypothetical protein